MVKEWKKFYRVIEDDYFRNYVNVLHFGLTSYDKALEVAIEKDINFKIESYYMKVEVEALYEYLVVFIDECGTYDMTLKDYYTSKEEFERNINNEGRTFLELVQSTKRERK